MARKISEEVKKDLNYSWRQNHDYDPNLGVDGVDSVRLKTIQDHRNNASILDEEELIAPVVGLKSSTATYKKRPVKK